MNMHAHRRQRLLTLIRDHYKNNRKKFCEVSGLSESRLGQLISTVYRRGQGFGEKAGRTLAEKLGLDPLYFELLLLGETSAHYAYRRYAETDEDPDDMLFVRQVEFNLTPGSVPGKDETTYLLQTEVVLCFHRSWLKGRHLLAENLICVAVTDASMSPRLEAGDLIVVDTADKTPQDNGVFLVNGGGMPMIKRMTRDFSRWFMTSDNANPKYYQREEFLAPDSVLLGRVVFLAGATL